MAMNITRPPDLNFSHFRMTGAQSPGPARSTGVEGLMEKAYSRIVFEKSVRSVDAPSNLAG